MTSPFPITQVAQERGLRLFRDPCYSDAPAADKDWFLEIHGRRGVLYGHNATSFWVDTSSGRASGWLDLGPIKAVVSPGGGEARFLFSIDKLDAALEALVPRKKRVLSPEARAALVEHGKKNAFVPGYRTAQEP